MGQHGRMRVGRWLLTALLLASAPAPGGAAPPLEARLLATAPELRPEALRAGLVAFGKAREAGWTRRPLLTLIDYGLPSTARRLFVLDVARARLVLHEWVAHGRNSGEDLAQHFSNEPGSFMSSLGLFLTGSAYRGRHGPSLRLHGVERGRNDRAEERAIVLHGADYVGAEFARRWGRLGRSLGCPAVRPEVAVELIDAIEGGTVLFAYHDGPRD
jgi:hypothetical protein